jgi:hypothetical protein
MFERVGSLAERVATNVSRRAFLGRLGQGALGLAAIFGGVLALPSQARADKDKDKYYCFFPAGRWDGGQLGCFAYDAVNGTCPCGGTLVQGPIQCVITSC